MSLKGESESKTEFSNVWRGYKNHSNPYIQGTLRVKKSCQYRLQFLRFHVNYFTVPVPFSAPFIVLPFRFAVLPFQVQTIERAVIAGEDLEVLKFGRCSTTILAVDTYAEPFGEPPIRARGPSAAARAARWFDKSQLGADTSVPLQLEFIHVHAQELVCERASLLKHLNDYAQRRTEWINDEFRFFKSPFPS